jgi:hypothetical protein
MLQLLLNPTTKVHKTQPSLLLRTTPPPPLRTLSTPSLLLLLRFSSSSRETQTGKGFVSSLLLVVGAVGKRDNVSLHERRPRRSGRGLMSQVFFIHVLRMFVCLGPDFQLNFENVILPIIANLSLLANFCPFALIIIIFNFLIFLKWQSIHKYTYSNLTILKI